MSSSGSCLVSPASAASSYLRTFFAHRRPQALHNVFGPRGPYNTEKLVGDRRKQKVDEAYLSPFWGIRATARVANMLFPTE